MRQSYTYIGNEPCNQEWFSCVGKVFHTFETLCFTMEKHFVLNA